MINEVIEELNSSLKNTVKGYKSLSLCYIESAKILFSESLDPDFDLELILACNLEIIKTKLQTLSIMGIEDDIDSIVFQLKNEVHIIEITEDKSHFIYFTIDGKDERVELAKQLLNVYKEKISHVLRTKMAS